MPVTHWTTNAHADFFSRNILSFLVPPTTASEGYETFRANGETVNWPDHGEVARWMPGDPSSVEDQNLILAVAAANNKISERTGFNVRPLDANGDPLNPGDPGYLAVEIPPEIKLAAMLQAARWYRRHMTPEGVLGANDFDGVVRVSRIDPDIADLIAGYRQLGLG